MYQDPNPHNKKVDKDEKEKRQFTVLLVFIVIVGLSLIAGILKFRQAKKEVGELSSQSALNKVPGLRPALSEESDEKKAQELKRGGGDERSPQAQKLKREGNENKRKLVPSRRDKETIPRSVKSLSGQFHKVKLSEKYFSHQGADYIEMENVFALPVEYKERYQTEEILGERHRKVFVLLQKGEAKPEGALPVAYNSRTKRVALVTGTLKVQFNDTESFSQRSQYLRGGLEEKSTFDSIALSLLQMEPSLSSLENLEKERIYWAGVPGVKKVSVELLEAEITVK